MFAIKSQLTLLLNPSSCFTLRLYKNRKCHRMQHPVQTISLQTISLQTISLQTISHPLQTISHPLQTISHPTCKESCFYSVEAVWLAGSRELSTHRGPAARTAHNLQLHTSFKQHCMHILCVKKPGVISMQRTSIDCTGCTTSCIQHCRRMLHMLKGSWLSVCVGTEAA